MVLNLSAEDQITLYEQIYDFNVRGAEPLLYKVAGGSIGFSNSFVEACIPHLVDRETFSHKLLSFVDLSTHLEKINSLYKGASLLEFRLIETLSSTFLPALIKFCQSDDIQAGFKGMLETIIKQRLLCESWPIYEGRLIMAGESDVELPEMFRGLGAQPILPEPSMRGIHN